MKRKFCVDTLRVFNNLYADVVELVDTLALGASAARREGSSPFIRTKVKDQVFAWSFTLMSFYAHARTHFSTKCEK